MKVLFVTRCLSPKYNDGGLMVTKRNYDMLKTIFGEENVDIVEFPKPNFFSKFLNILLHQSYGQTITILSRYEKLLKQNIYDFVFFNSSLYGNLVKYCANQKIPSYVFFHNVEAKYYKDLLIYKKNLSSIIFHKYIRNIEKQSCQYSTYRIVLNKRDEKDLFSEYGVSIDLLLPISMKCIEHNSDCSDEERFCLFLGSDFWANRQGLSWFIENVIPHINIELKVCGSICNFLKTKYSDIAGVTLLGYIDDIANLYENALFVVSPIFSGSGMKTKTVEALAHGKSIIGTDEAFVGIDADFSKIGAKCNTADEFINSINTYNGTQFNEYSYNWFNNNLSDDKIYNTFLNFVNNHYNK